MATASTNNIALQQNLLARLEKDILEFEELSKTNIDENHIRSLIHELELELSLARSRHDKICLSKGPEVTSYSDNNLFGVIRSKYHSYWGKLNSHLPKISNTSEIFNSTMSGPQCKNFSELKLPKVELPTFNGAYEEWMAFHNMFTATVHNNMSMEPIVKLQRLKAALTGDAALIVKNLELNAANYTVARSLLLNRYQHSRRLVNSYMKKLFDFPNIKIESSTALKNLINTLNDCTSALSQLDLDVKTYILIYIICRKLPQTVLSAWEESLVSSNDLPTFEKFSNFLEARFRLMEMIEPSCSTSQKSFHINSIPDQDTKPKKKTTRSSKNNSNKTKGAEGTVSKSKCILCKSLHNLNKCDLFLQMSQPVKLQTVKDNQHCVNCLSSFHTTSHCGSKHVCRVCSKRHHTLLHRYTTDSTSDQPLNMAQLTQPKPFLHVKSTNETGILLGTAQVRIMNPCGLSMVLRALIDPGSEDSYIIASTVNTLQLKKFFCPSIIGVLGEDNAASCDYKVDLFIKSLDDKFSLKITAGVIDRITSNLPSIQIPSENFGFFNNLALADSTFNEPSAIHVLLGIDVHTRIRLDQSYRLNENLIAENTLLGYLIRGRVPIQSQNASSRVFMVKSSTEQLSSQIQRFWETEELHHKPILKPEDEQCENNFKSSIHTNAEGFLTVDLPFKSTDPPIIGPSRYMAVKRFLSLEKKLQSNDSLRKEYHDTINNYLQLNHLRKCSTPSEHALHEYYLPHHAVVKESSSTTKVRVVFDASCKSLDGFSLNDHLLTGPKLQRDIRDILFNWRQYPFSITSDIEKMYRMFKVNPTHYTYQKIVWRFNETDPIEDYLLTTVTFGTSCAPFLALRCLQYIADMHEIDCPLASAAIRKEFYVDDFLSGGFSVDEARQKQSEVRELLRRYKLTLRKWSSNNASTLSNVPKSLLESTKELTFDETEFKKTLGLFWSQTKDAFSFSITPAETVNGDYTKRQILSLIARLYDPLGWVSPCTMFAKVLMQKVWQTKTGWDEPVEDSICAPFKTFLSELKLLNQFEIPRWSNITDSTSPLTIYGFSDASDKGYSAVVYLLDPNTKKSLILLTSKTKVADLKFQSTARLELNGALLLSELLKWTVEMYSPRKIETLAFCDSKIVLAWLNAHPSKWKTYIANRTSQILQWMHTTQWNYIDTKLNPADCASRGLLPSELLIHPLWLYGPNLADLQQNENESVPLTDEQQTTFDNSTKKNSLILHSTRSSPFHLFTKYSSHKRLLRVTTRISQFIVAVISNLMEHVDKDSNIEADKLKLQRYDNIIKTFLDPEVIVLRQIQQECYADEIKCLNSEINLSSNSKLKGLHPFIDGHGIMRVGGRLQHSELSYAQRHPIILPRKHQVVTNIIREAHESTLHGTELLTQAYLRNQYHIPRMSEKVSQIIHQCVTCFRFAKYNQQILMGSLPKDRTTFARPFSHAGVDYAGPLTIKAYRGRCKKFLKSYVAVFICLCTKAVHLELVSDLTTLAFLAAFKRFVGRRGRCQRMYSDNGTTFVGANKRLKEDIRLAEQTWKSELEPDFHEMGTEWHFIPPSTPHFGGLWEAAVKSTKTHLKKTIGSSCLTFEELTTILVQIEAVLNSRPLCPMSDRPNEFNFLTPSHFLIGESLVAPPETKYEPDGKSYAHRWIHVQASFQRFVHLWKRDYLNNLQNRPKGVTTTVHYKPGDLVLLTEDDTPPTMWPMVIIDQVHPGEDGIVRVVTIRTPKGKSFRRPVAKLRLLPTYSTTDS